MLTRLMINHIKVIRYKMWLQYPFREILKTLEDDSARFCV